MMAVVEQPSGSSGEPELLRLWGLIVDLSEQLNQNRALTSSLQNQANLIKGQAVHAGSGFPLRRFNLDLSKESFESELVRLTQALIAENAALGADNKHLGVLLREHESTLESIMSAFRAHAHQSQITELALARQHESNLLQRDTQLLRAALGRTAAADSALSSLSTLLRNAIRLEFGDPLSADPEEEDHAMEREAELARLEAENEMLRGMLRRAVGEAEPPEQMPQSMPSRRFTGRRGYPGGYDWERGAAGMLLG